MNGLSEAVIVCRGNLTDPAFFLYLAKVKTKLQTILSTDKESLQVEKVEKWNSVRVTFRLPPEAANRLRQLSIHKPSHLGQLGIRSVTVDGTQLSAAVGSATANLLSNASTSNGSDSGFDSGSASAASAPEISGDGAPPNWPACPAPAPLPSDTGRRNVLHYLMHNDTTPGTSQDTNSHCSTASDVFRVPTRPVASPAGMSRAPAMAGPGPSAQPQQLEPAPNRTTVNNSPLLVGLLRSQSPGGTISGPPGPGPVGISAREVDYYLGHEQTGDPHHMGQMPGPPAYGRPPMPAPQYSVNNRYPQEYVQSSYGGPYGAQGPVPHAPYYPAPQQAQPLVPNCEDSPPPKKKKRTNKKKQPAQQQGNPYVEVSYQPSTSQYHPQPVRPSFNPQDRSVMWQQQAAYSQPLTHQPPHPSLPPSHHHMMPPSHDHLARTASMAPPRPSMAQQHPQWVGGQQPMATSPPHSAAPYLGSQTQQLQHGAAHHPPPHPAPQMINPQDVASDMADTQTHINQQLHTQRLGHQQNSGCAAISGANSAAATPTTLSATSRPSSRQRQHANNPASDEHIKSSIEAVLDKCKNVSLSGDVHPSHNNPCVSLENGPFNVLSPSLPVNSASSVAEALRATSPVVSSEKQLLEKLKGQLRSSITSASLKGTSQCGTLTNGGGVVVNGDLNSGHTPPGSPTSLIQKLPNPILNEQIIEHKKASLADHCYEGMDLSVAIPSSHLVQTTGALSSNSNLDSPTAFNTQMPGGSLASRVPRPSGLGQLGYPSGHCHSEQASPASSTGSSSSSTRSARSRRKLNTSELVRHSVGVMEPPVRGTRSRDSSTSSRRSTNEQNVDTQTCRISLEAVGGSSSGTVGR